MDRKIKTNKKTEINLWDIFERNLWDIFERNLWDIFKLYGSFQLHTSIFVKNIEID